MTRVLIDTNVLIDLVSASRPAHGETVSAVRSLLVADDVEGCILSSSLKDVYYVYCRHYGDEAAAREAIRELRRMFVPLNLTTQVIDAALDSDEPNFEDGIVRAAAELAECAYLLTRDAPAFSGARFEKIDAAGLCDLLARR